MPTGTFSKIFNNLVADTKVFVKTNTRKEHELLRTRLCKHFSRHKDTMLALGVDDDSSGMSILAEFKEATGISIFKVGVRKSKIGQENKKFEILTDANTINTTVELGTEKKENAA